ncbi:MAG: 50S ribosomal protein L29 [Bacteroidota bacterium]
MKNSEVRELGTNEIIERIENEQAFLLKQKMNHAVSPLDNPQKIMETRKNVARLKTELRKREIEENKNK